MKTHISRMPTLTSRLGRLPLSEIRSIMAELGIDSVSAPGNVAHWPWASQVTHEVGRRNLDARLDAVLQTVEQRLGLESPDWLPWPIVITVDTCAILSDGKWRFSVTSEDIGLFLTGDSPEEAMADAYKIAADLLLCSYGIDVAAINKDDDRVTRGFECLKIETNGWLIECHDRAEFDRFLALATAR